MKNEVFLAFLIVYVALQTQNTLVQAGSSSRSAGHKFGTSSSSSIWIIVCPEGDNNLILQAVQHIFFFFFGYQPATESKKSEIQEILHIHKPDRDLVSSPS